MDSHKLSIITGYSQTRMRNFKFVFTSSMEVDMDNVDEENDTGTIVKAFVRDAYFVVTEAL